MTGKLAFRPWPPRPGVSSSGDAPDRPAGDSVFRGVRSVVCVLSLRDERDVEEREDRDVHNQCNISNHIHVHRFLPHTCFRPNYGRCIGIYFLGTQKQDPLRPAPAAGRFVSAQVPQVAARRRASPCQNPRTWRPLPCTTIPSIHPRPSRCRDSSEACSSATSFSAPRSASAPSQQNVLR